MRSDEVGVRVRARARARVRDTARDRVGAPPG